MREILVIGGGWAGCSAALAAAKQGARVRLLEKTDLLLGAGNAGGIMRNNGRFTAAEENIALGAGELFWITDRYAVHRDVDFPGHAHASFYDAGQVEAAVRRLLKERGIEVCFCRRAVDIRWEMSPRKKKRITAVKAISSGAAFHRNESADCGSTGMESEWLEADAFVEATGSSGPMGNCMRYGRGCAMCVQRCPAFGPRVSLTARAGACKLEKKSLSPALQEMLSRDGFAVVPLPPELVQRGKLKEKVCQQYALDSFAENLILIDTGEAKLMTPFFPLEQLRTVEGFEEVRFLDPCAGGRGNSVRYMSVGLREDTMLAEGFENLFLGGEKSGFFVGHTEAITTGSLAGYNAARFTMQPAVSQHEVPASAENPGMLILPRTLAAGELLAYAQEVLLEEDGLYRRLTFAGGEFFQRMKDKGLYRMAPKEIRKVVEAAGLLGVYEKQKA